MHYFAAVVIPTSDKTTIEADPVLWDEAYFMMRVQQIMDPFDENLEVEEHRANFEEFEDAGPAETYMKALEWNDDPACTHKFEGDRSSLTEVLLWFTGIDDWQQDEEGWYRMVTTNPQGEWDWWQIGGRWTGVWSGYDPEKDPANIESCWLCQGTGFRDDENARKWRADGTWDPEYGCNGCESKGQRTKWPTQWARHQRDAITAEAFLAGLDAEGEPTYRLPHTLVSPGSWQEKESYNAETGTFPQDPDWTGTIRTTLEKYPGAALVIVDYHR